MSPTRPVSLPGVDPASAPSPDDPLYGEWLEGTLISPEGIDRGSIWEFLRLTPEERLARLERVVDDLLELRGGEWPAIR